MQLSSIPAKIAAIFAASASSLWKNTVPLTQAGTTLPGQASFDVGFPSTTMQPLGSGGILPFGQDFNGVLNAMTAVQQWQCAGGIFKYDATFSSSIGGYPKGAILASADSASTWLNTVDNNTTNPDSAGTNWITFSGGRLIKPQTFVSSGTYTPTPGATRARFRGVAAGGAGGGVTATGASQASVAGGGSAGNSFDFWILTGLTAQTITIGAAGAVVSGGTGGSGGDLVIGSLATIKGGAGGNVGTPIGGFPNNGGNGGVSVASTISGSASNVIAGRGQAGGTALLLSSNVFVAGIGGTSMYGSGGTTAFAAGSGYGAGGQGAGIGPSTAATFGNGGAPGILTIEEYA